MPTETRRTTTTLIFDLRDFTAIGEGESYFLCLSENTYRVVLGLFQFYGYWLNRYTPDTRLDTWYQPEGDQAVFVGDMYDKGMEELLMPTCVTDLVDAINNGFAGLTAALGALDLNCAPEITVPPPNLSEIVKAIQDIAACTSASTTNGGSDMTTTVNVYNGCCPNCGGSTGQSTSSPGGNPYPDSTDVSDDPTDTPPTSDPTTDEFPSSMGSLAVFNEFRCNLATQIATTAANLASGVFTIPVLVNAITLSYTSGTNAATNAIVAALATAGFGLIGVTLFPLVLSLFPVLLGFAPVIMAAIGSLLAWVGPALSDDKDTVICDMLEASDGNTARASFLAWVSSHVTANTGPLDGLINQVYATLFPPALFAKLFYDARSSLGTLPAAECDCDGGGGPTELTCWTFPSDLQGFTASQGIPTPGDVDSFPVAGTLQWVDGVMRMHADVSSTTTYVTALSPEFDYVIQPGDVICQSLTNMSDPGTVMSNRASITVDGVSYALPGSSGVQNTGAFTFDLSEYVGQHITQLWFGWFWTGNSDPGWYMDIDSFGLNCPECID